MDYKGLKPTKVINVLGTDYKCYFDVSEDEDTCLRGLGGYCDKTDKRIVVVAEPDDSELTDWGAYRKTCIRHELIHAFLIESGIGGDMKWDVPGDEHPEGMVSWIAMQFPKMLKAFEEAGAL